MKHAESKEKNFLEFGLELNRNLGTITMLKTKETFFLLFAFCVRVFSFSFFYYPFL